MSTGTSAPRLPLTSLATRAPGSVRRTMHVDVGARTGWGVDLVMSGAARDLRTGADPAAPEVLASAEVHASFDGERTLVSLECDPVAPWAAALVGARAGGGFRKRLEEVVPGQYVRSLLRQVLDDMPAAVLISGYGFMRLARRQGLHPASLTPPDVLDRMVNLCSGWRAGGTAVDSIEAGHGVPLQDCPPAPPWPEDDPYGFHPVDTLAPDAMRRRRCLDASPAADGSVSVWAMFRDSVGEPHGGEAVLHEYAVRAEVRDDAIAAIVAEPRVLPFLECPGAAGEVARIVGVAVAELPLAVPEKLVGVASCTHLNDLLRALGGVASLLALVG